jgi:hypothetical protein
MVRATDIADEIDLSTKWWVDYPAGYVFFLHFHLIIIFRKYVDKTRAENTYQMMLDNVWSKPKSLARSASFTNLTYIKEAQHDFPIKRSPSISSLAPSLALPQHYRVPERIVHTQRVYKPHVYDWYSNAYSPAKFTVSENVSIG